MRPVTISGAEFTQEVLNANQLTLVYFEVPWLRSYRRIISPILDVISDRYDWEIKIVKIDMEKYAETAEEHGVKKTPAILFFAGGKIVDRYAGLGSIQNLDARIQRLLSVLV